MKIKIETPNNYKDQYIENYDMVPRIGEKVLVEHSDKHRYNLFVRDVIYDYSDNSVLVIVGS
jgi:hypothetical protein